MRPHAIVGLLLAASTAVAGSLADGDAAWERRAEGHENGRPQLAVVTRAIDAYQRAVDTEPTRLDAHWKLLRAVWFAGEFAATDVDARRPLHQRGKAAIDGALAQVAVRLGNRDLGAAAPEHFARDDVPDTARVFFWSAVTLGSWTRSAGLVAAVRAGVANRMRTYLDATNRLDPSTERGGPLRLLSRLHAELPHVPLVSGWVDRDQALPLIEEAYARYPEHPGNRYLLGMTLVERAPERRDEGLRLITEIANREPDAGELIEQLAFRKDARERLESLTVREASR
jgi:hypothetical protein